MEAIAYAIELLSILPSLIGAGRDVRELVENGTSALKAMQDENREPTAQEWDALNALITSLRAELHDGEEDLA